ncbi:MAG TPA: substrate-binding domain-containing protein [Bacteroidota bacterium]|nr:substrate-binding domain-containing protein [Bacteroidota bacterium]
MLMSSRGVVATFAILLSGCNTPKEETPTRGRLEVAVTRTHVALLQEEAREFNRLYPEAVVTVTARSTREAVVALLNDSLSLICIDRPLNEEERTVATLAKIEFVETKIAEDALGIIVHPSNPINEISLPSLEAIFRGAVRSWSGIQESKRYKGSGTIDVVLTDRNSGAYELLAHTFLKAASPLALSHTVQSSEEILRYVATHPHAISAVSALALRDSATGVKVLAVQTTDSTASERFIKLHQANIYRGWYPLRYPLYFYSTATRNSVAAGFTAFVASAPGQKIIVNAGLVPTTMPVRLVQINEN